jgi:tetratricopeptide (TPR) repeat protein
VRPVLRELVGAHLVTEYAPRRYRMHDLVRLYARELAAEHGPGPLKRLLDHYLRTACAAALRLKPHRQPIEVPEFDEHAVLEPLSSAAEAMAWFVRESAPLVAAVSAADAAGFPTHVWQLVWAMTDFFERHGRWRDYIATAHVALSAAIRLRDTGAQARARRTLSRAHLQLGECDTAHEHQERAVTLYAENGDLLALGHMRIGVGQLHLLQGHVEQALENARRGLVVFRQIGHRPGEATALNAVGWCEARLGMLAAAEEHCRASLALHREVADRHGQAGAWDSLGYVLVRAGRHDEAVPCFEESLALARELRDRASEGEALGHLGDAYEAMGDRRRATSYRRGALRVLEELDPAAARDLRAELSAR